MDEDTYTHLLSLVSARIQKCDTQLRKAITAHERLTATLRFLATGRNYTDLKFTCGISQPSLSIIIPETCEAICSVLLKDVIKFPKTTEEWASVASLYEDRWNFPNCLGSIDGKHVRITPPKNSGAFYRNYKGYDSLVLLAVVDADYKFLMVDFGTNGRVSDGGVIENTKFYKKLIDGKLNLPNCRRVGNRDLKYVFVGDEAFALKSNFMKPFNVRELSTEKRIYNYRLSRARRVVENVFDLDVSIYLEMLSIQRILKTEQHEQDWWQMTPTSPIYNQDQIEILQLKQKKLETILFNTSTTKVLFIFKISLPDYHLISK
ncbi:protein ALP1-like [Photinus pyralis]|uniref:protein ALP1-like n=1 Tax=Photinus pyralis TaxID=7054 RepID=UPI0012671871|nr:protein ALP1-like [Photinus pyralis]